MSILTEYTVGITVECMNLIQVFTKQPVLGRVKTRLAKDLGAQAALDIHCALVRQVVATVTDFCVKHHSAGEVWYAALPHSNQRTLSSLTAGLPLHVQQGSDLGARMLYSFEHGLARPGCDKVVIIGGDCIAVTEDYLQAAFNALDSADIVMGPAEDGGYILMGARCTHRHMFQQITWGTETVFTQQVRALENTRLSYATLETRWDIDRVTDLKCHAPHLLEGTLG